MKKRYILIPALLIPSAIASYFYCNQSWKTPDSNSKIETINAKAHKKDSQKTLSELIAKDDLAPKIATILKETTPSKNALLFALDKQNQVKSLAKEQKEESLEKLVKKVDLSFLDKIKEEKTADKKQSEDVLKQASQATQEPSRPIASSKENNIVLENNNVLENKEQKDNLIAEKQTENKPISEEKAEPIINSYTGYKLLTKEKQFKLYQSANEVNLIKQINYRQELLDNKTTQINYEFVDASSNKVVTSKTVAGENAANLQFADAKQNINLTANFDDQGLIADIDVTTSPKQENNETQKQTVEQTETTTKEAIFVENNEIL